MKAIQRLALIAIVMMVAIVSGCSGSGSPKAALQEATNKTMEAGSYAMTMTMTIDELELPDVADLETGGLPMPGVASIIQDATIKVNAIHSKEQSRTDMDLELTLPGLMNMQLTIPIIVTEEVLFVKLPAIPLFPLPESVTDKYIRIDLKELAEQQGAAANLDVAAQQKLVQELSAIVLKHFDEKTYFSQLKADEAGLPDGLKVDQIVKFAVNEQNYDQTVETIVEKLLPDLFELLLANEAYLESLGVQKTEIEDAKAEWDTNKAELRNLLLNDVRLNDLELTGAIKDKYLVYQNGRVSVDATDPDTGQSMKFGLSFTGQYSDIGKVSGFDNEVPTDTITIEQLFALFQSPLGL